MEKVLLPTVVKENPIQSLTIEEQTGLSCEQLAATRVSAVENSLLQQQDDILTSISTLKERATAYTKERDTIKAEWKKEQEKQEAEKIGKELAMLTFASGLTAVVNGTYYSEKGTYDSEFNLEIQTILKSSDKSLSGSSIIAKISKVSFDQATKEKVERLNDDIASTYKEIEKEQKRIQKCALLLANMDREERRATAQLIDAKLQRMEGGQEMLDALRANLPRV